MLSVLQRYLRLKRVSFWRLTYNAIDHVMTRHEILGRASSIAFTAMMAFVPFLTLLATIAAHLLPNLADPTGQVSGVANISAQQVIGVMHAVFPNLAASIIVDQIVRMQAQPPLAVLSVTILLCLWTSSGLFATVINAINRIYEVPESRSFWRVRLITMALTMVQSAILFGSVIAIVAWPQILTFLGLKGSAAIIATGLSYVTVFAMIFLSFAALFKMGPSLSAQHQWVSPGALFGTVMFLITTMGFRVYVQYFAHYATFYGSLGGVMMLMFWMYLMSVVLLMAAEMNKLAQLANRAKKPILPAFIGVGNRTTGATTGADAATTPAVAEPLDQEPQLPADLPEEPK